MALLASRLRAGRHSPEHRPEVEGFKMRQRMCVCARTRMPIQLVAVKSVPPPG